MNTYQISNSLDIAFGIEPSNAVPDHILEQDFCSSIFIHAFGPANSFYGKTHSEETRQRMSLAHKNSERAKRQREKIYKARPFKIVSEETRRKMSIAGKGKKRGSPSLETREKMRLAAIARGVRQRNERNEALNL